MRLLAIQKLLIEKNSCPYIIFSLKNIAYLTGFKGSNGYLIIDKEDIFFITDSRYQEYAESILPKKVKFILQNGSFTDTLKTLADKFSDNTVYLEKHSITLSLYETLIKETPNISYKTSEDYVNQMRIIKDENEIDVLKKAAQITDNCVEHLKSYIKPGITEWDVAIEIEYFYKKNGCRKTSFDSIVASGAGASMPHYTPSMTKKIRSGEMVLIDMGCEYNGYNSDLTRTLFVGSITKEFEEVYQVVSNAQQKAINLVKEGMKTSELDNIAREVISNAGYGKYFGHSLGHGIGIDVHELPAVNSNGEYVLQENVIISIEPGIYLPKKGGVRIEDMVRITKTGCEVLTKSSKEIIIL